MLGNDDLSNIYGFTMADKSILVRTAYLRSTGSGTKLLERKKKSS